MANPIKYLSAPAFLEAAGSLPVLDVRSPSEYLQGHIPGAFSFPLFNDEERAVVGTIYKNSGRKDAIIKGLEFIGPKMKSMVIQASAIARKGDVLVHCWRGGMRSESVAWLLNIAGINSSVLEGGYKAYRHYIRESFSAGPEIIVLGGYTGSGKTEILKSLREMGQQVIDLEGLANHKGSVFGGLGQKDQPNNEQFENDLAKLWLALDPRKAVWLENESRHIGHVAMPDVFYKRICDARVINIEIPVPARTPKLVEEYGLFDKDELIHSVEVLRRRLGGDQANKICRAIEADELDKATVALLNYYDRKYLESLGTRDPAQLIRLPLDGVDPVENSAHVLQKARENNLI